MVRKALPLLDEPEFGDRIADLRASRNLTQDELANHLGIKRAALAHYENCRREPDYNTLLKIADFFKVSTDFILRGEERKGA